MRLLERRDYGRDELAAKLVEKGFEAPEAAAAADRCVALGFINDENYAAMVARHYTTRGFGERRVLEELRRIEAGAGVDADLLAVIRMIAQILDGMRDSAAP